MSVHQEAFWFLNNPKTVCVKRWCTVPESSVPLTKYNIHPHNYCLRNEESWRTELCWCYIQYCVKVKAKANSSNFQSVTAIEFKLLILEIFQKRSDIRLSTFINKGKFKSKYVKYETPHNSAIPGMPPKLPLSDQLKGCVAVRKLLLKKRNRQKRTTYANQTKKLMGFSKHETGLFRVQISASQFGITWIMRSRNYNQLIRPNNRCVSQS